MTQIPVVVLLALATVANSYPSVPPTQAGIEKSVQRLQDCLSCSHESIRSEATDHQARSNWKSQTLRNLRISGDAVEVPSHPDITQVITERPPLVQDFNIKQDPPPSEEELQIPRRRRDAGVSVSSAVSAEYGDDDDSDMYLEPDGESETPKQDAKPSEVIARYEYGLDAPSTDNQGYSQHFFPSFAPVFSLGHSRPPQLFHQESQLYKPRTQQLLRAAEFNPFRTYRENNFQVPIDTDEEASSTNGLLGSGNFGVIRGGTYYNDEDRNSLSEYYNNGHGRPAFNNPRPQKYTGGDFFANFRDFADINTPTKASFSEFVIVYVNKNGSDTTQSTPTDPSRPKNIIEQLSLLDKQAEESVEVSEKKLSSHKRKLSILRKEEEDKQRKAAFRKKEKVKDNQEPLLALS